MDESSSEELIEIRFIVPPDRDGWRLDRFLSDRIPRLSRSRIRRIIEEEALGADGKRFKPAHKVRWGEEILIYRPPFDEPETPRDFSVVHEDAELYVIDKPAGLPVHPTAKFHQNTVTFILRERFGPSRPVIAHRLDRETSGLLVCAKTKAAERAVKLQFEHRTVRKEYLALVQGTPVFDEKLVDIPLGPAIDSAVRIKMGPRYDEGGLPATTELRVLDRFETCTLIAAHPLTGRQHQIRAHLAEIGHPIIGDKIYGIDEQLFIDYAEGVLTNEDQKRLGLPRQALHAHLLELTHPVTGERLELRSELPSDIVEFLESSQPYES